uniref:HD-GYP domain-containing protein n=1 Tax=uncultured Candidatus Melainabacteria bacterium TaxID=2682970 RepID=A0A650EK74_9BACT|nr:hypothetical protein Melaina855_2290 [uncultured Candidatus Melainabacteria bacterium]
MEVFNPSLYSIGLNSNIQLNRFGKNVYFGQNPIQDSFQSTSPVKLFNENEIKKMISQNTDIKKLLSENKIPIRLNMTELKDLAQHHCKDTQEIAASIANNLPQSLKQQVNIKNLKDGAMLHDFGKVLIPAEILNKNGALTPEEHKIMDLHSELGYQLLKNSGVNDEILKLVRYHHDNKQNNFVPDINLQILNLADKYSALTEERVYKEAFSPQKALTILYSEVKKGDIHPFIFNALVKSIQTKEVPQIVNKY